MKRVLVVMTNHGQYGNSKSATGVWLGEVTEFVRDMRQADIAIDYASPSGGYVPVDPRSLKYANNDDLKMYHDLEFRNQALANSLALDDVVATNYNAIYFAGGHGAMWDFPNNEAIQEISMTIYRQGGYVTSVCHGIAALLNLKNDNQQYLISGHQVTGFTATEEILSGKRPLVPFLNAKVAKKHKAFWRQKRAYKPFVVTDGQLITGQNPFSTHLVAQKLAADLIG